MAGTEPMRICQVHNAYGRPSGEEEVVALTQALLEEQGHQVSLFGADSVDYAAGLAAKAGAFCSGIYNPRAVRRFRQHLLASTPELVHVHNLYPKLSAAILPVCTELNIPIVMTVHNYRLVCPNGLLAVNGMACNRCIGGREYWCVLRDCEHSLPKSLGYALRSAVARRMAYFSRHVSAYLVVSRYQQQLLVAAGIPAERMYLQPHSVAPVFLQSVTETPGAGGYVAYAGRIAPGKGIETLLAAARRLPQVRFRLAGTLRSGFAVAAPDNVEFCGYLQRESLPGFYDGALCVVQPSELPETFGLTVLEAMARQRAVIATRSGALEELVNTGETGLLVEPCNSAQLAHAIRSLWEDPMLARRMGLAAGRQARQRYSNRHYLQGLLSVYRKVFAARRR